jgi:hypothetical protein
MPSLALGLDSGAGAFRCVSLLMESEKSCLLYWSRQAQYGFMRIPAYTQQ